MSGHIHTDVISIIVLALGVELVFHVQRMIGAYLAGHGAGKAGTVVGGLATFS